MDRSSLKLPSLITLVLLVFSGCSSTTVARDFNGLESPDGKPIAHLSTSNVGLHLLLGKKPIAGDASLEKTVSDFTLAAKGLNATKVRIVQSSQTKWWFIMFPFTVFVTPVTSNVAANRTQDNLNDGKVPI